MTIEEAWNRGNNLVATAVVSLAGFAFLPEFFLEDEWLHKLDDGLLFLLGISAIVWYRKGNNRFTRSVVPIILVIASLIVKIVAIFLEFKDKEDIGDDFGGMILFILSSLLVLWLYKKKQKAT